MKISVFSSDTGCHKFVTPIMEAWQKAGHEVTIHTMWSYTDADVLWFDFCDNNLIVASRDDKEFLKSKKVMGRIHAVEYYMGFHRAIDWSCVNDLIFVSDHMKRLCNKDGELPVKQHVIYNGIDLDKLQFKERKNGLVLGYAGNIVPAKGMVELYFFLRELRRYGDYKLKMVGLDRIGGRDREYIDYIRKDLPVEQSEEVSDINVWLDGIDYLWQPSHAESFSYIIGEAMAKGIKPIINDYYGSREVWPEENIYNDFTSFKEIVDSPYESNKYREFVQKYSFDNQLSKFNEILNNYK